MKNFKCEYEYCEKTLATKSRLKTHIMVYHEKSEEVACDLCGKPFALSKYLKRHIKYFHQKIKPKFECEYCDKYLDRVPCTLSSEPYW